MKDLEGVKFSSFEIKKKSLEITGSNKMIFKVKSPGKVKIIIKCTNKKKFNRFKKYVNSIKPIGSIVAIYKGY